MTRRNRTTPHITDLPMGHTYNADPDVRKCTLCGMRRSHGLHAYSAFRPLGKRVHDRHPYRTSGEPRMARNGLWTSTYTTEGNAR